MNGFKFIPPKKTLFQKMMAKWINHLPWQDFRYKLFSKLPYVQMKSEAINVVYMNWVVPISQLQTHLSHLIPKGTQLIEKNGQTILTILTYQHAHFGPKFLGRFRCFFPSPMQSNWRLYLDYENQKDEKRSVVFIKNMMNSALYSYVTRLFTDVLPTHLPEKFTHCITDKYIATEIKSGESSASEIDFLGAIRGTLTLPIEYLPFFESWEEAMRYLCLQTSAMSVGHSATFFAEAEIKLPVDVSAIKPIEALDFVPGDLLTKLGVTSLPFCFLVKNVVFEVLSEKRILQNKS